MLEAAKALCSILVTERWYLVGVTKAAAQADSGVLGKIQRLLATCAVFNVFCLYRFSSVCCMSVLRSIWPKQVAGEAQGSGLLAMLWLLPSHMRSGSMRMLWLQVGLCLSFAAAVAAVAAFSLGAAGRCACTSFVAGALSLQTAFGLADSHGNCLHPQQYMHNAFKPGHWFHGEAQLRSAVLLFGLPG
jgi:hypothetical protein